MEDYIAFMMLLYLLAGAIMGTILIYGTKDESKIPEEDRIDFSDLMIIIICWPLIVFFVLFDMFKSKD